jgi:hypothetical protein
MLPHRTLKASTPPGPYIWSSNRPYSYLHSFPHYQSSRREQYFSLKLAQRSFFTPFSIIKCRRAQFYSFPVSEVHCASFSHFTNLASPLPDTPQRPASGGHISDHAYNMVEPCMPLAVWAGRYCRESRRAHCATPQHICRRCHRPY